MKKFTKVVCGLLVLVGFIAALNLLHAQETAMPVQTGAATVASESDLEVMLQAVESVPPMPASSLPSAGTFWSAQHAPGSAEEWPPLPISLGMGAWSLGNDGVYLLDDLNHVYASPKQSKSATTTSSGTMMTMDGVDLNPNDGGTNDGGYNPEWSGTPVDTNGLWLQIFSVSNGVAYLSLNNATDQVYEVMSRTNLISPGWQTETELFPTNGTVQTNALPFTVPELDRTNALFFRAMDWTGVTENGNTIPDWWFYYYYGTTALSDSSPDSTGHSLLSDYENTNDPNVIQFSVALANNHVNSMNPPVQLDVTGGVPSHTAVIVNAPGTSEPAWNLYSTNNVIDFSNATWQAYDANPFVPLDSGEGGYDVWIGLKGLPANAQQTWVETTITLDTTPPSIVVTGPAATVSQPVIQVTGYANENLASLTYDVTNAAGIFTNRAGSVTDEFYDTNLLMFVTNYFQCYDVALTNGLNRVTIHATDLAGNVATTNASFTLNYSGDHTAPVLTVLWPTNGTLISGTNFTLQAQVDDDTARVTASIVATSGQTNTVSGLVERSGAVWFNGLALGGGTNTVTLTATDAAGNASLTTFKVVGNDIGLVIDPISGDQLNQSSVSVTGSIGDQVDDCVWVNGVQAYYTDDAGDWEADYVPVSPGGTAIVSVQVYVGDPVLIGSQTLYQLQPVTVGLMSYSSQTATHILDPTLSAFNPHPPDGDNGGSHPVGGPVFLNDQRAVNWTYQSGGTDSGYDVFTGTWNGFTSLADRYNIWDTALAAGQDAYGARSWENNSSASSTTAPDGRYSYGSDHTVTRVMIEPTAQQGALGGTMLYRVRAEASGVDPTNISIRGVRLADDGDGWGEMTLAGAAGANMEVTPVAPGNYTFNVQAFEADGLVAVDNNRDGNISFDNSDETSAANPYRFWINDSQENGDISSADAQIPGSASPNYANNQVNGRADVVNFFPVALNLTGIMQQFPLTNSEYHLSQADNGVKMVYTGLTPDNAFDYLTDPLTPSNYGVNGNAAVTNADTLQVTGVGMTLNTNWLAMVQTNGGKGVILLEGCTNTANPLKLEIWQNGQKVTEVPLYLSISGVEQMFRQINLRFADGSTADPGVPPNYPDTLCNGRQIIFIHGFSVGEEDTRGWNAETFKRLYQANSHAMFTGVDWQADDSPWFDPTGKSDYYDNVKNAFLTASNFDVAVSGLPGTQKYVIAHSLGNMVASSAIADFGLNVNSYFAFDAAVATEAYDGVSTNLLMVNPDASYTFEGWTNYDQSLWAGSWHNLFSGGDGRTGLTWTNRFGVIGNFYNFYSSGEDVLMNSDGTYPSPLTVYSTHEKAWVCQEMSKGDALTSLTSSGSQAGWQLNVAWYIPSDPAHPGSNLRPRYPWEAILANYTDSSHINTNDLPTIPFFEVFNDSQIMDASAGSAEAAKFDVRADILGGGIPALSHATGANFVAAFGEIQNTDLMSMETTDGDGNFLWPSARPIDVNEHPRWLHSDFEEVAYPFNYNLYNLIVNDMNN